MASTIKIPGIGPVKSTYVYIGGAAIAGFVAFSYYRASQTSGETEEIDATDETGMTFGDAMTTDFAPDGSGFGFGFPTPTSPTSFDPDLDRDPTTDNEWVDRVIEFLDDVGVERNTASLAISRYRLKDCLSASQMDIVRQGVGRFGPPPQSPNLAMIQCPAGPTTPPPSTTTPILGATSSIKVGTVNRSQVRLDWTPVSGARGYTLYKNGARITSTVYSVYTFSGLKSNTTYKFGVATLNAKDQQGSQRTISVKTKR